jgi:hypothetical protein
MARHFRKLELVALVLLLIFYLFIAGLNSHPPLTGDAPEYWHDIQNVCHGSGFRDSGDSPVIYRPPGFIWLSGQVLSVFGQCGTHSAIYFLNAILIWLSVVLLWLIASRIAKEKSRFLAALPWLVGLNPMVFQFIGFVLAEALLLFASVIFLFFVVAVETAETKRGQHWLAIGVSAALLVLCKATFLPGVAGVVALIVYWNRQLPKSRLWVSVLTLLLPLLVINGGYILRNHRVSGHYFLVNSQGAAAFFPGTISNDIQNWNDYPELHRAEREAKAIGRDLDEYLNYLAWKNVQSHPLTFTKLVLGRALRFVAPMREYMIAKGWAGIGSRSIGYAVVLLQFGIYALAFLGFCFGMKNKDRLVIAGSVFWGAFMLVHALVCAHPRYQLPAYPWVILFALYAVEEFVFKSVKRLEASN